MKMRAANFVDICSEKIANGPEKKSVKVKREEGNLRRNCLLLAVRVYLVGRLEFLQQNLRAGGHFVRRFCVRKR